MSAPPEDGYRALSVAEVLADLPSLDADQLLLVKSLEQAGERRSVIFDRIADLLVVREAVRHGHQMEPSEPSDPGGSARSGRPLRCVPPPVQSAAPAVSAAPVSPPVRFAPPVRSGRSIRSATRAETAPPVRLPTPVHAAAADKAVSTDLLNQMGGLLAKDDARKSPQRFVGDHRHAEPASWSDLDVTPNAGKARTRNRRQRTPSQPSGHIVPTDWHRPRRGLGKGVKVLAGLLIVAIGAVGGLAYRQRTKSTTAPPDFVQPPDPLARLIVESLPGSFTLQATPEGLTGPSDTYQAARHDGGADAQGALTQAGFLHGYQHLWSSADNRQTVALLLYHFRTEAGATAYGQRMAAAARAKSKPAPTLFVVAGPPGATGLSTVGSDQAAQIVVSKGAYLIGVVTHGPVAATAIHEAQVVAAAQYATLP